MEQRASGRALRAVILYDGTCPLCLTQMRFLRRLDWLGKLELIPLQDARVESLAPSPTRAQLLEAIHAITPQGTIYRGAYSFRFIAGRLPLLTPLALLLRLPGMMWIAGRVYARISARRHRLSRWFGCQDACAVAPARPSEREPENLSRP